MNAITVNFEATEATYFIVSLHDRGVVSTYTDFGSAVTGLTILYLHHKTGPYFPFALVDGINNAIISVDFSKEIQGLKSFVGAA